MNEVIMFGLVILIFTIVAIWMLIILNKKNDIDNKKAFENGDVLFFKDEENYIFIEDISIKSGYKIKEMEGKLFIVGFDKCILLSNCSIVKK